MERAEFSRQDTLAVKGAAVILMMAHHLLAFPERTLEGLRPAFLIPMPGTEWGGLLQLLAMFGKLCVPLFFFLSGFGQYRSWERHGGRFDTLGRVKRFYLSYWKVFVLFVPVALICFGGQTAQLPTSVIYRSYDRLELFPFLQAFFGVEAIYCAEWWFIRPYLICTLLLPLWTEWISRHSLPVGLLSVLAVTVLFSLHGAVSGSSLFTMIFGENQYCLSFWMGTLLAKDHAMEHCMAAWKKHGLDHAWIELAMLLLMVVISQSWPGWTIETSVVFVPVLVLVLTLLLRKAKALTALISLYGRHSTTIWLTHTFLCYYFVACQKIVYAPRYAVLCLIWFMALGLGLAVLVDGLWAFIAGRGRRESREAGKDR